jgi:hypothetical protein
MLVNLPVFSALTGYITTGVLFLRILMKDHSKTEINVRILGLGVRTKI